jgi:hypoxanthine phosphoribosyltransferase
MYAEVERVLISSGAIAERVRQLGQQLATDYANRDPLLVGVLTGAFVFMADLVRATQIPLDIEFMAVSSYGLATQTSGIVRILKDLERPIEGRDVLFVEDIVDTGLTLQYLLDVLLRRSPRSLCVVALLNKQKPGRTAVPIDYVGFEIPDSFVVGYGLDAARKYRNLPHVAVIRPSSGER